jgi:crotonyl-CoA carboxylase/reductase
MAAGINYNGLWLCRGKPVPLSSLKTGYDFHITGTDASGIVWQVGESVRGWKPGDEVVVHGSVACGQCPVCNGFNPLACKEQKIWGYETNWGAFAPFAKVRASQLLPKPPHLSWAQAASYEACLVTAYRMLVTQAHIQAGEYVLIWGAAGGLGIFAIQLCQLYGANVIGVVSSDHKAEFCRDLGCKWTINRLHFDFSTPEGRREFGSEISRLTGGNKPNIVFEHVGWETFPISVGVCDRFGRIVICGATTGYKLDFDARSLWIQQKSILGCHASNLYEADQANRLVMAKRIHPLLWKTLSFESIPEGIASLGLNSHMGKMTALVQAETLDLANSVRS